MLDEALLRPGRLEVQVEIGLPDEKGRLQILKAWPFHYAVSLCAEKHGQSQISQEVLTIRPSSFIV